MSSSVAVDAKGNVFLTGAFTDTVNFGGGDLASKSGSSDIFVASYTQDGVHRWSKAFGDAGNDEGEYLRLDSSGNVYVIGLFTGPVDFGGGPLSSQERDAFIASFTGMGAHRWSKGFGGKTTDSAASVAADPNGNVYLFGTFATTADFGGGPITSQGSSDAFLVSFTSTGAYRWSKTLGGADRDSGSVLTVDAAGDVFAAGRFRTTTNIDGDVFTSKGEGDIFIISYDSTGSKRWTKPLGGTGDDAPFDLVTDRSGNLTLTGRFQDAVDFGGGSIASHGGSDIFLASYSTKAAHRWSKAIGGIPNDAGRRLAVDSSGNIFLTGFFSGTADPGGGPLTSQGSSDVLVASYDSLGVPRWQKSFGDNDNECGYGIAVSENGCHVTLSGWFRGKQDFGGGTLTSKGSLDIFVVQFSP